MITISIDCAPGSTRPGTYFKYIVNEILGNSSLSQEAKDYIKEFKDKEKNSSCFGNWTWELDEPKSNSVRTEILNYFGKALTGYYNTGCIRSAEWS